MQWTTRRVFLGASAAAGALAVSRLAQGEETRVLKKGRAMVDAVRKTGRIVQIGFQRRQSQSLRAAVEFIKSGGIGKLVQVDSS